MTESHVAEGNVAHVANDPKTRLQKSVFDFKPNGVDIQDLNLKLRKTIMMFLGRIANEQDAWWYSLFEHDSQTSVAHLLGLPANDMTAIWCRIGVATVSKYKQQTRLCIKEEQLHSFIHECQVDDNSLELRQFYFKKKKGWFLRIGKQREADCFNAFQQSRFDDSVMVELMPSTNTTTIAGIQQALNYMVEMFDAANLWINPYDNKPTQPNQQAMAKAEAKRQAAAELERVATVKEQAADAAGAVLKLFENHECLNPTDYPVLQSYNINVKDKTAVNGLMRDIFKLSNAVSHNETPFSFPAYNGKTITLVQIPKTSGRENFKAQSRRTKWVQHVLKAMLPEEHNNNNELPQFIPDEADLLPTPAACAEWLMVYLGTIYTDEFVKAARTLCMPVIGTAMKANMTFGMWSEANCNIRTQRVVKRFFKGHFGCSFTAPEQELRKLGDGAILPDVQHLEHGGEFYKYWTKQLDVVVSEYVAAHFKKHETTSNYTSVDVNFGGDHGQGSFRFTVEIILRDHSDLQKKRSVLLGSFRFGEIVCRKDFAQLLKLTLLPQLNIDLESMIHRENDDVDGSLAVYRELSGHVYAVFKDDRKSEQDVLLSNMPLYIKITGDLSFYADVQGKEHMASCWCPVCQLRHAQWQHADHEKGTLWTEDNWKETYDGILNGSLKTANEKKGIVERPLIVGIKPCNYVIPILHCELGVGNRLLSNFSDYIDRRLELMTPQAQQAEAAYWDATKKHEEASEIRDNWALTRGIELTQSRAQLKNHVDTQEALTRDELKAKILELTKEKDNVMAAVAAAAKTLREKKKIWNQHSKDVLRGRTRLRTVIEHRFLIPYNVKRATYHGGELTGNSVRALMANSTIIFSNIKPYLASVAQQDNSNWSQEMVDEMMRFCDLTRDCLILFDGLFSLLRETPETITPEKIAKAEQFKVKALQAWRSLGISITVKAHLLEDHSIEQMRRLGGLGDCAEDFVEREHQEGVKDRNRSKGMRDQKRKFESEARWQHQKQNENVKAIVKEVTQASKRHKKHPNSPRLPPVRIGTRETTLQTFVPSIVPTADALNCRDYLQEQQHLLVGQSIINEEVGNAWV